MHSGFQDYSSAAGGFAGPPSQKFTLMAATY